LVLSFDLGGSSTELLLKDREDADPIFSRSVFIGAATLTEAHLQGDPPSAADVGKARAVIRQQLLPAVTEGLERLKQSGRASLQLHLVGTAGTATTLAAMSLGMGDYEPSLINGAVVQAEWLGQMVNRLAGSTLKARRAIAGLEPGREDIILGGALIVREILVALGKDRLIVTDAGLLEGLLLELVEEKLGLPEGLSPLTWRLETG
jgi:exopolyphosphatase/guanosine-5'-triphosphate,3'-diphosphate pyrophosphatase